MTRVCAAAALAGVLMVATSCHKEESVPHPSLKFVTIPPGSFEMGSDSNFGESEPRHHIILTRPFDLQTTPVTQAQWTAVMGSNPSHFRGLDLPVETVSAQDVEAFIRRVNEIDQGKHYRLPTEAEWEYACRAGHTAPRYGVIDDIAWYNGNSDNKTHPVGQKDPNAFGLYDMLGNVWELTADWMAPYQRGAVVDPTGPKSGYYRVSRGGSFYDMPGAVTATFRSSPRPEYRGSSLGFRLARDASK